MFTPEQQDAKHGQIGGSLVSEEALASSKSIFQKSRSQKDVVKGFQQYFTPQPIADFVANVVGQHVPAIDLQAGNGSMLQGFYEENRFGIEIDRDQIARGSYNAIKGDAQLALPMMRAIGQKFPSVVLNPPFGLSWADEKHPEATNSCTLSFLWALDLMLMQGTGAILLPTSRLITIMNLDVAKEAIFAVVDLNDKVWPGEVEVPCSIAFFTGRNNKQPGMRPMSDLLYREDSAVSDLRSHMSEIRSAKRDLCRYQLNYVQDAQAYLKTFRAARNEYEVREAIREGDRKKIRYDVSIKKGKLQVYPSAYAQIKLAQADALHPIQLLNQQNASYFGQNTREWKKIIEARDEGHLTLSPGLEEKVSKIIEEAEVLGTPLFPVKPPMRLGWCEDLENIKCVRTDPEQGFTEGASYPISTWASTIHWTEERPKKNKNGEPEVRKYQYEKKVLVVSIAGEQGRRTFNESPENIAYLMRHFAIPDPGDIKTRFPEKYEANMRLLEDIERDVQENVSYYNRHERISEKFRYKFFQKDHLARLMTKERGPLLHEQGLGKTLMLMTLAEAQIRRGCKPVALFVVPQDLVDQWQDSSLRFFGRTMEYIKNPADARDVARRILKEGETGWFITNFEALSRVGVKKEVLPEVLIGHKATKITENNLPYALEQYKKLKEFKRLRSVKEKHHRRTFGANEGVSYREALHVETKALPKGEYVFDPSAPSGEDVTTDDACPNCLADSTIGWRKEACQRCGYTHRKLWAKSGYKALTKCFIDGVMCVDELSEIRSDDSLRSKSLRALARGKHKYGGTGTPISNYVNDSFWGFWWCLGDSSIAFPYSYRGGKAKYEQDFCVIEYLMGQGQKDHVKMGRKVKPMVTNVSQFWRMTQPSVSRCRKEQTGEPIVERKIRPIVVPQGVQQLKQQEFWLYNFARYFAFKHPDHKMVKDNMFDLIEKMAAMLGGRWKVEEAATMPGSDEALEAWPVAKAHFPEPSNWTPANLKTLELAIEHAQNGEKVIVGSDLIATGHWLSERLNEKGIRSVHIVEDKQGKLATKNPKKRAADIRRFATGDAQVLCTGIAAMKLGHNLDIASTMIVHGLPDSYMMMDQFIARAHRLTSKKPVTVYVVLPRQSLAQTKWKLLKDKGGASDLALDGELSLKEEKEIDWNKVLREMREKGIRSDGTEVLEADVYKAWCQIPKVEAVNPNPGFTIESISPPAAAPQPAAPQAEPTPDRTHRTERPEKAKEPEKANGSATDSGGLLTRLSASTEDTEDTGRSKKLSWDDVEAKATTTKESKKKSKVDELSMSLF